MNLLQARNRVLAILLVGGVALPCLTAARGRAADYGRIAGIVSDAQGSPLMGASVSIVGPLLTGLQPVESAVARVITDAHGRFAVERLVPGRYSLQVTSVMRLPILRSRLRIEAGQTLQENLVLSDILAPLRLKVPAGSVSSWGDDWKWVLRTSSATRPVLRFQEVSKKSARSRMAKVPLPASQGLVGMIPGSTRRRGVVGDPGIDSVLAYLRPLSEDADLLVAGSMGASGLQASSLATVFRRDLLKGDPQELALIVHQLSFADGLPLASGEGRDSLSHAQALVVSYAQTRRILDSLVLTAGMEIDYLNAAQDALSMRPSMKLEYRASPANVFAVRYGALRVDGDGSLLERVGVLTTFPRVTLRGYRPQLERLNHAELSYSRLGRNSRLEFAAYRDYFEHAAVWGLGGAGVLGGLTGNFLPNPAANGVTLHAGNYTSSGLRAAYTQSVGSYMQMAVLYALGDALSVDPTYAVGEGPVKNLRSFVRPRQTQIVAGKVTARLPRCRTQITTSYEWLPSGRVADVDPYGQANLQLQPFLGVQIRQPLPSLAFLSARIEALADFRNLLAQGYVPVSRSGDETLQLTPAYRSFQGGFSVQF
jgi:hypothetical protein